MQSPFRKRKRKGNLELKRMKLFENFNESGHHKQSPSSGIHRFTFN